MDEYYLVLFLLCIYLYIICFLCLAVNVFYLFQLLALHSLRKPYERIKMRDKHKKRVHGKREQTTARQRAEGRGKG